MLPKVGLHSHHRTFHVADKECLWSLSLQRSQTDKSIHVLSGPHEAGEGAEGKVGVSILSLAAEC